MQFFAEEVKTCASQIIARTFYSSYRDSFLPFLQWNFLFDAENDAVKLYNHDKTAAYNTGDCKRPLRPCKIIALRTLIYLFTIRKTCIDMNARALLIAMQSARAPIIQWFLQASLNSLTGNFFQTKFQFNFWSNLDSNLSKLIRIGSWLDRYYSFLL